MQVVSLGACCSTQQAVGMAPRMQRYNRQLAHSKRREPTGKDPEGGRILCARLNQATAEPAVHDLIIVLRYSGTLRAECASVDSQDLDSVVCLRLGQLKAHIRDPERRASKARNVILLCTIAI